LDENTKSKNWVIDSGATDHMTHDERDLNIRRKANKAGIINANGDVYPVESAGDILISPKLTLYNTLLVPSLSTKLLSVGKLTEELNCVAHIFPNYCVFHDLLTKEIVGHGTKRSGLYYLDNLETGKLYSTRGYEEGKREEIILWHRRLGHPSFGYLEKLSPHLFSGLTNRNFFCETYIKVKSHKASYQDSLNKSSAPFDLIHTDVWGPCPVISRSNYRWFVLFVDDHSRMTWLYLLKTKDEVHTIFKDFHTMVLTQFGKKIKMIRSDNGTEYINKNFQNFLRENGILHETSCVGTPQQNGVAERKNRHILEVTRALLLESQVPREFWDHALSYAVYLINRMPTQANKFQTPLQAFTSHINIPSILNLSPKLFGCVAFVHIRKQNRTKLDSCAEKCIFLGFGTFQKGYKCYNPLTGKWYTSMDVMFNEREYFFKNPNCGQGEKQCDQNTDITNSLDLSFLEASDIIINMGEITSDQSPQKTSSILETVLENEILTSPESELVVPANEMLNKTRPAGEIQTGEMHPDPNQTMYVPEEICSRTNLEGSTSTGNTDARLDNDNVVQHHSSSPLVRSLEQGPQVCNSEQNFRLPPRTTRGQPPKRYVPEDGTSQEVRYPIVNYTSTKNLPEPLRAFANKLSSASIPERLEEAKNNKKWVQAMETEMNALERNQTWELVDLPEGKKTVGCR
jgi:transposase InsO family protein